MPTWSHESTLDYLSLSTDPIKIDELLAFTRLNRFLLCFASKSPQHLATTSAGAVSSFLGTTRDTFEDQVVTHLEYESYPEMALECMKTICVQVRETRLSMSSTNCE